MAWNWSPETSPFGPDVVQAERDFPACEKPAYPGDHILRGRERSMTLRLRIGADGTIRQSEVVSSSGLAQLDGATLAVLGKCRFAPAVSGGVPVESWSNVIYTWVPRSRR